MSREKLSAVQSEKLIHLTTRGRKTGRAHTVELWFAIHNDKIYLSHEGRDTDWMKNISNSGEVTFEIGGETFDGRATYLEDGTDEALAAKAALYRKYYGAASKEIIEDWFSLSRLLMIETYKSAPRFCATSFYSLYSNLDRDPRMNFEEKVWNLMETIPRGRVTTYGFIAKKLRTKAYRAVGNACRRNPYAPRVPCHRVVRSDGAVGGFRGKTTGKTVEEKTLMLRSENVQVKNGKVVDFEKVLFKF